MRGLNTLEGAIQLAKTMADKRCIPHWIYEKQENARPFYISTAFDLGRSNFGAPVAVVTPYGDIFKKEVVE